MPCLTWVKGQGLAKAVVAIIIAATSAAATSQKYLGVISQHQQQQQQPAKHCECGNSCWAGSAAGHDGDRGEGRRMGSSAAVALIGLHRKKKL